jgi:hypothetical protein
MYDIIGDIHGHTEDLYLYFNHYEQHLLIMF